MENDKQKQNRALSVLKGAIEDINSNNIHIGEYEKQIKLLIDKNLDDFKKAREAAALYYTPERIAEIHEKSLALLHDAFDKEEYIHIFSDISLIKMDHIHSLMQHESEIAFFEAKLNDDPDNQIFYEKESKFNSIMAALADILMKGGANRD